MTLISDMKLESSASHSSVKSYIIYNIIILSLCSCLLGYIKSNLKSKHYPTLACKNKMEALAFNFITTTSLILKRLTIKLKITSAYIQQLVVNPIVWRKSQLNHVAVIISSNSHLISLSSP